MAGTVRAAAMNGYVILLGFEAFGQGDACAAIELDVEHGIATITVKMAMLAHVGTEPGCATLQGDLFNQTALHKRR